MKRTKSVVAGLLALSLALPIPLLAETVKLILKDGSVVSGELLGIEDGTVSIQQGKKSKDYGPDQVKKAFDSEGKRLDLGSASAKARATEAEEEEAVEEEQPKPKPKAKAKAPARDSGKGARIAGNVVAGVGLVGFLGGCLLMVDGNSKMDAATSTYYTAPYSIYYYTIDGKKGYYSAAQYEQYYAGQTESNFGIGFMVVGGIMTIAGVIVSTTAGRKRQTALLDIRDHQYSLAVPEIQMDPGFSGLRGTLLEAQF